MKNQSGIQQTSRYLRKQPKVHEFKGSNSEGRGGSRDSSYIKHSYKVLHNISWKVSIEEIDGRSVMFYCKQILSICNEGKVVSFLGIRIDKRVPIGSQVSQKD